MSDTRINDWSNYWTGRVANEAGAALVGVGIETDETLAKLWAGVFDGLPAKTRVLDLACGAGAALKAAAKAGLKDLTGLDMVADAIVSLQRELPQARGVVAPANQTGLTDNRFDLVVSQFGFEYAGAEETAHEVSRILAAGGQFAAICHYADGAIADECQGRLDQLREIEDCAFIPRAKDFFRATYATMAAATREDAARAVNEANAKADAFKPASERLIALAQDNRLNGLAGHLYQGAAQLFERRAAYALIDVETWLDGMQGELDAYTGRMQSMVESALDADKVRTVLEVFQAAGFEPGLPKEVKLAGSERPSAWFLRAGT